jgi:hypothetical protein
MITTLHGNDQSVLEINSRPDKCPQCHHAIRAIFRKELGFPADDLAEAIFECPNCGKLFIAYYGRESYSPFYHLTRVEPSRPTAESFGPLDAVSPVGVRIFNQAVAAEAYGLDEIAGIAYRRALEFFIKDFCIALKPTESNLIRAQHKLGIVIETYIDDSKLRKAAKMTAWLGNDETHYERRWESKDISDLKKLLKIVVNSINESLELAAYEQEMMPPKQS